jgi:L-fuculokinase
MWFLGIDIGTTHIKVVGVTGSGTILSPLRTRTPVVRRNGLDFHDGEQVWSAVKDLVERYAAGIARPEGYLGGLSIATFGQEEAIPVDRRGKALFASLAWWEQWPDASLSPELAREFDSSAHYAISGVRFRANQTPERIAHLRQHERGVWADTHLWVDFGSFITWKLTGEWTTSVTQITHSQLFDVVSAEPDVSSFEAVGLAPELFPSVRAVGSPVGEIRPNALGGVQLTSGALLYMGGHDQVLAAYTSALSTGATVIDSIGTAEYLMVLTDGARTNGEFHDAGVEIEAGWLPGQYVAGWGIPTGKIFQSVATLFFNGDFELLLAAIGDVSHVAEPSAGVRLTDLRGETGLLSLDNIAAGSTPASIARRVADQIALETRSIVAAVTGATATKYDRVAITGSLFQRQEMLRHREQFWDVPLQLNPIDEAVATGAALIAHAAHTDSDVSGIIRTVNS